MGTSCPPHVDGAEVYMQSSPQDVFAHLTIHHDLQSRVLTAGLRVDVCSVSHRTVVANKGKVAVISLSLGTPTYRNSGRHCGGRKTDCRDPHLRLFKTVYDPISAYDSLSTDHGYR